MLEIRLFAAALQLFKVGQNPIRIKKVVQPVHGKTASRWTIQNYEVMA